MRYLRSIVVILLVSTLLLLSRCGNSENEGLSLTEKPDVSGIPELRPLEYIPAPEGFKNVPFIETAPEPVPTENEKKYGFILFSRPITQPVFHQTNPLPHERITSLSAFATRGEFEPLTLSVYPLRDMDNFRVIMSDLENGNSRISGEDIDIRLVTEHAMRYPFYTSPDTYRDLPELLQKVTVNSFAKDKCQRYWITVHVPKNAEPGIYHGSVFMFDDKSEKAVKVPVSFRVLPYKLKKDPHKHFSSFMLPYSHLYRGFEPDKKLVGKAITADFANMLKFGFDYFPDFYLRSREADDGTVEFYIKPKDELMINKAIELGFGGRLILVGGTNYFLEKYHPECKPDGGHGKMNQYPPADSKMFPAITKAVRKFIEESKAKGYPELLFFIADEPREHNAEYMSRVYEAFKKAGAMTFLSNDPSSGYSHFYRDKDVVDIWCSQAFAYPYEKIVSDKDHEYWTYPNHNAGEKKDRVIEQKGGRMTYGFGFWKSGYSGLFPWAWRWEVKGNHYFNHFDYIYPKAYASGCGNRLDDNANFVPAINWECFREGYDDGRYLYTLQQVMKERQETKDEECLALLNEGKELLDSLWKVIEHKKKYLKVDFFADRSYNNIRWQIASLTMKLLQFDAIDTNVTAPSVMADTKIKAVETNDSYFIEKGRKQKIIQYYDMAAGNFSGWKANKDKELRMYVLEEEGKPNMVIDVTVDQKHDGANSINKNPIGWPLVHFDMKGEDISAYDFLTCNIKFESNRDNVTRDVASYSITKVRFVFRKEKGEFTVEKDLGGNENLWQHIRIPITKEMNGTKDVAVLIYEGSYPDHTHIVFDISEIGLLRFSSPFIKRLIYSNPVLTTDDKLIVKVDGFAFETEPNNQHICKLSIKDNNGKIISKAEKRVNKNLLIILPINDPETGGYSLEAKIYDQKGKLKNKEISSLNIIEGYLK